MRVPLRLFVPLFGLVAGCSSSSTPEEGASSTLTSAPRISTAEIATVASHWENGNCRFTKTAVVATLPDVSATASVRAALEADSHESVALDPRMCQGGPGAPTSATEVTIAQQVDFNESGLLTVTTVAAAKPFGRLARHFRTTTFDLATGQVIPLSSAIDAFGMDAIYESCFAFLNDGGQPPWSDYVEGLCRNAITGPPELDGSSDPTQRFGVAVHALAFHVRIIFFFTPEDPPAMVVPVAWRKLRGHITHPTIAALANEP